MIKRRHTPNGIFHQHVDQEMHTQSNNASLTENEFWKRLESDSESNVLRDLRHLAQEIVPSMFLSGFLVAKDLDFLKRNQITDIMLVRCPVESKIVKPRFQSAYNYHLLETVEGNVEEFRLNDLTRFVCIAKTILDNGGRILVNGLTGTSRSAAFVAACLMGHYDMPCRAAVQYVCDRRPSSYMTADLYQLLLKWNAATRELFSSGRMTTMLHQYMQHNRDTTHSAVQTLNNEYSVHNCAVPAVSAPVQTCNKYSAEECSAVQSGAHSASEYIHGCEDHGTAVGGLTCSAVESAFTYPLDAEETVCTDAVCYTPANSFDDSNTDSSTAITLGGYSHWCAVRSSSTADALACTGTDVDTGACNINGAPVSESSLCTVVDQPAAVTYQAALLSCAPGAVEEYSVQYSLRKRRMMTACAAPLF